MTDRTPEDPAAVLVPPVTSTRREEPAGATRPGAAGRAVPAAPAGTAPSTSASPAPQLPGDADPDPAGSRTRTGLGPAGATFSTEPAEGARGGDPEPGRGFPPPRPGQGDPRTWTIELPAGMPLLSLNGREHWSARHARAQAFKNAAIVMARQAKLPKLRRVSVVAEYQPPDRRHRDGDNIAPAAKAAVDGLVAAGILAGDDKRYVTGTCCMIGEPYPKGRLVLRITEVAP